MIRTPHLALAIALTLPAAALGAKPPAPSPFTIPATGLPAPAAVAGVGQVDAATGVARMLVSPGFRGDAADPVGTARAYLAHDAQRLGLAPGATEAELAVRATRAGRAATVVRFAQRFQGIPVHDGEIAIAVDRAGRVSYVASTYRANLAAPVNSPRLDGAQALDAALRHLGGAAAVTFDLERRIYAAQDGARLVWRALVDPKGDPEGEWEILVDAESGAILAAEDKLRYADTTGKVFDPDPLSSALVTYGTTGYVDGNDANSAQLTAQTFDRTLLGLLNSAGTLSLDGPRAKCVDWALPAGTCPTTTTTFTDLRESNNFEGVNVYYHLDTVLRYLNDTLGVSAVPYQAAWSGKVPYDPRGFNGDDNSSYSSSNGLQFGEGGVDDAEDADVVIHELGHGIHDWVTSGSLSQVEGLSEGTGDYFAVSYSRSIAGQWAPADPQYNWVFSWDGHNPFWGGRVTNYDETHTYPVPGPPSIHTYGQLWASCSLNVWEYIGRDLMDAAMVEGLAMTNSGTNQPAAAQAVLTAAWNMGYGPSVLQIFRILYTSGGCLYGVIHPPDPNRLFFDGFEYTNTALWNATCPPTCGP